MSLYERFGRLGGALYLGGALGRLTSKAVQALRGTHVPEVHEDQTMMESHMSDPFDSRNWSADFGYVPPPRPGGAFGPGIRPGTPGIGQARQAMAMLQRKLEEVERSGDLAGLQYAFDNFRDSLKRAFPAGGPNGAVG